MIRTTGITTRPECFVRQWTQPPMTCKKPPERVFRGLCAFPPAIEYFKYNTDFVKSRPRIVRGFSARYSEQTIRAQSPQFFDQKPSPTPLYIQIRKGPNGSISPQSYIYQGVERVNGVFLLFIYFLFFNRYIHFLVYNAKEYGKPVQLVEL